MYINQRLQRKVATGLMILFLAFALVPIYLIMAKFATGGHYAQLCTATGMQTVWVVDEPEATSIQSNATAQSSGQASDGRLMNPFGCCEFCWTSVERPLFYHCWWCSLQATHTRALPYPPIKNQVFIPISGVGMSALAPLLTYFQFNRLIHCLCDSDCAPQRTRRDNVVKIF